MVDNPKGSFPEESKVANNNQQDVLYNSNANQSPPFPPQDSASQTSSTEAATSVGQGIESQSSQSQSATSNYGQSPVNTNFSQQTQAQATQGASTSKDPNQIVQTQSPQQPTHNVNSYTPSQKVGFPGGFRKKNFLRIFIIIGLILVLGALFSLALKLKSVDVGKLFGNKGEITWWGVEMDEEDINPLIEEYQQQNPSIKITYIKQSENDYRERLINALVSEKGPDIFEMHNTWPPMFASELAVLPTSIMSTQEFTQTFYPVITKDLTTQKGIVGMPLEYDALTLFVNDDIFASSGKQAPKTWDELRDLAKVLTQKGEKKIIIQAGVALGVTNNVDHWPEILALMLIQNKVNLANPQGKLAEDALEYYMVFARDKVWDAILPPSTIAFTQGKLAMYFAPTRRAFEILKGNPNLRFKTVTLPQLPKGSSEEPDISYATYWVQGVWEKSSNKKEAWEFLKYLSTKESIDKLNKNIQVSKGLPKMSPRMDSNSEYLEDPILGSIAVLANNSTSWYLADETYDGETGINSQFNAVFREIIDSNYREGKAKAYEKAAEQIRTLLSRYGLGG